MQVSELKRFAPTAKDPLVNAIVRGWAKAEAAGITTPLRIQHFLTQIATETGGLRSISESLNYSAKGLLKTFNRSRISAADCQRLGRTAGHSADQQAIASRVYGGKWGRSNLGNTLPDDGWRYRGGGMLQTTGRANYRRMGFEDNPEGLRDPDTAFGTAVREWEKRGCNATADADDLNETRRKINGGLNGIMDARGYLARAKRVFT